MKYLLRKTVLFFFILVPFSSFSQASGTADFEVVVKFADNIPVSALTVAYLEKGGNRFYNIHYRVNYAENEMTIFGRNHYILWVSFPTLVFSFLQYETDDTGETKESTTQFYLGTNGCLSSYSAPLNKRVRFSMEDPNWVVVQENWQAAAVVKKARLSLQKRNGNDEIFISNRSVKIFPEKY